MDKASVLRLLILISILSFSVCTAFDLSWVDDCDTRPYEKVCGFFDRECKRQRENINAQWYSRGCLATLVDPENNHCDRPYRLEDEYLLPKDLSGKQVTISANCTVGFGAIPVTVEDIELDEGGLVRDGGTYYVPAVAASLQPYLCLISDSGYSSEERHGATETSYGWTNGFDVGYENVVATLSNWPIYGPVTICVLDDAGNIIVEVDVDLKDFDEDGLNQINKVLGALISDYPEYAQYIDL